MSEECDPKEIKGSVLAVGPPGKVDPAKMADYLGLWEDFHVPTLHYTVVFPDIVHRDRATGPSPSSSRYRVF